MEDGIVLVLRIGTKLGGIHTMKHFKLITMGVAYLMAAVFSGLTGWAVTRGSFEGVISFTLGAVVHWWLATDLRLEIAEQKERETSGT